MEPPEAEPREDESHQRSGEDIEAKVHEIGVAGRGDVDGDGDGDESDYEEVDGGSGGLRAEDFGFGESAGRCGWGEGGIFFVGVDAVGGVWVVREGGGVGAWEEVRDCDGEFGAEEEG